MQTLNNWDVVENGVLKPQPSLSNLTKGETNYSHFKIPLMLRSIGSCIFKFNILGYEQEYEEEEYKLIPLGIFKGGLKILIFLNPTAFSVMTNLKEFEVLGLVYIILNIKAPILLEKTRIEKIIDQIPSNHENPRRYTLKNATIKMTQYRLDESQLNQLLTQLGNGLYKRNFNEIESLNIMYMKPYPVLQYTKNLSRKNIQRCLIVFTSDMYKRSPFARQHDRFNKGIKNITFKLNGEVYPRPTLTRHNSLFTSVFKIFKF